MDTFAPFWRMPGYFSMPLLLALALAVQACGLLDNDDDDSGTGTETITINVEAEFGGAAAACDTDYENQGSADSTVQLRDARFYLSNIYLENSDGEEVELELEQDGEWQVENVVLIDLEDATGLCAEDGTAETNNVITGTVKKGDYSGIAWELGVPFDLNHTDTTTAESPLNIEAMAWGWQFGRKFTKIDFDNADLGEDSGWFVHLGSTGCEAESAEDAPVEECTNTNRPAMHLHDFDPEDDTIVVDFEAFLAGVDLSVQSGGAPGCMSGTTDVDCETVFPAFGLDLDTGECVDECHDQALFTF